MEKDLIESLEALIFDKPALTKAKPIPEPGGHTKLYEPNENQQDSNQQDPPNPWKPFRLGIEVTVVAKALYRWYGEWWTRTVSTYITAMLPAQT